MMKPTVHINGTSSADLLEGYTKAISALRAARQAVIGCAPHGRDYYPQPDNAIQRAIEEHVEREHKLNTLIREMERLAEHVINVRSSK